jgi:energy-coupling factor transport system ATP-binding protein
MISVQKLSCRFPNVDGAVFSEVSFSVEAGECVLIQGRSGGGKTTLLYALNGVAEKIHGASVAGDVVVNGMPLAHMPLHEIGMVMGTVFQDCRSQFFMTHVDDELVFAAHNYGCHEDDVRERLQLVSQLFDLEVLLSKSVFHLSSGERQRVAIASVAVYSPQIFLLDEPSANLDQKYLNNFAVFLQSMKKNGKTLIVADHRYEYASPFFDGAYRMESGYLTSSGLPIRKEETSVLALLQNRSLDLGDALVELRDLGYARNGKQILHSLNACWREGDVIAIIGGNGTGKTTLLRIICGLERQKHGDVLIGGKKNYMRQRISKCYMVMQDPDYQLFRETVRKELLVGGVSEAFRGNDAFTDIARRFELEPLLERHPGALSMGEKQRTLIGAAYMSGKNILLLDEPTSGMDEKRMERLAASIKELAGTKKLVIIATHDKDFIYQVKAKVCELRDGHLITN